MPPASTKSVLLISESLILEEIVPQGMLDAERFDLRCVQHVQEMAVLAKVFCPKILILDLRQTPLEEEGLKRFVEEIHAACREKNFPLFPVLGVLQAGQAADLGILFAAGINSVIDTAASQDAIQSELYALAGLRFRRSERKPLALSMQLKGFGRTWMVKTSVINLECVLVEAAELPLLGTNVLMESLQPEIFPVTLWAYVWQKPAQGQGILLRFLQPPPEFLEAIQNLAPEMPPVLTLPNPPVQASASLAPQDQAMTLKILLDKQLDDLRVNILSKDFDKPGFATVVVAHEREVKQLSTRLQELILESIAQGHHVKANELNSIKSDLQRSFSAMQKLFSMKSLTTSARAPVTEASSAGFVSPPAPKSSARKESVRSNPKSVSAALPSQRSRWVTLAVAACVILFPVVGILFGYWQMTAPQRRLSPMSTEELGLLSPYIATVQQYRSQDQYNLTVILNEAWNTLSKDAKEVQLGILAQKFRLLKVDRAELIAPHKGVQARYFDGDFRAYGGTFSVQKSLK